jgi:hypothetical protein
MASPLDDFLGAAPEAAPLLPEKPRPGVKATAMPAKTSPLDDFLGPSGDAAEALPAQEQIEVSQLEALGRGVKQGLTLDWGDEITGAFESAFTDKTYKQAVAEARAADKAAKDEFPITYGVGEIGSQLALGAVTGGAGMARMGLGAAATFTNAGLTGAKAAMASGALLGGVSGAGRAEGDVSETIKQALTGAVVGGAAGGVTNKVFSKLATREVAKEVADKGGSRLGDLVTGAIIGGVPMVGGAVAGAKVAQKGAAMVTKQLSGLVTAARQGDLSKRAVLKAIEGGVSVSSALGAVKMMQKVPEWYSEVEAMQ